MVAILVLTMMVMVLLTVSRHPGRTLAWNMRMMMGVALAWHGMMM
jgi:hypothetical protein